MIFRVPLPYRECSQNGAHGHWSSASKARAQYRADVSWHLKYDSGNCVACLLHAGKHVSRVVSLIFCTKGSRAVQRYAPRDEPNAVGAFKAGFDAMKDVGLLVDDSARWMRLEGTRIDNTRGPFVEIEVRDV